MKTLEQLTSLLNTLNDRNNRIAELIVKSSSSSGDNIINEGVFGSGGTFPVMRLPSSFQQPAQPIIYNPQGQPQPGQRLPGPPAGEPPKRPQPTDTRTVIPQSKSTRDQDIIMQQIADIKKELQEKLKVQLKEGKITKKEFADKMAEAQQRATAKERDTLRTVMGPEANKDYIEIMKVVQQFRKKVRTFKGTTISGEEANDIKDLGQDGLARIYSFKQKYPKLVDAHPEIFNFDAQIEFLEADPVSLVAEEQGTAVTETGIKKAADEKFKEELEELNQNAQLLQRDFDIRKAQDTISPAEIKQMQKQAKEIYATIKRLEQLARQDDAASLTWTKRENEEIIEEARETIKEVMNLQLPNPPAQQLGDIRIQNAIYRLLAYTAGVFILGAEYDKSTFNADLDKINGSFLTQDRIFKRMADNSAEQIQNVRNTIDNFLGVHDEYDRQFEGKNYKIGKGGTPGLPPGAQAGVPGARRMMPVTDTAEISSRGRVSVGGFGSASIGA